jgi:hypothetical protein
MAVASVQMQDADIEMMANDTEQEFELVVAANASELGANATDHGFQLVSSNDASATEQQTSATEQGPESATVPRARIPSGEYVMEIYVEFNNGMWWSMPHFLSDPILQQWSQGSHQVQFIWNWQNAHRGSWQPIGPETSINRYVIDFDTMQQRNRDNERTRRVKVVCVLR